MKKRTEKKRMNRVARKVRIMWKRIRGEHDRYTGAALMDAWLKSI